MTDTTPTAIREEILAALSVAGAFCGDCGFEPGEAGCSDCVRVRDMYADALTPLTDRLTAERDELLAELNGRDEKARKRWIKNQEKQLGIRYADFRDGRWEMDLAMGREMAAAYVAMAKTMLGDAPNYSETRLEFDVKIAESPEVYTLVVQRNAPGALTPHEARQRAEAEVARLRAELAQHRDQALAEAAELLRGAWTVAESALERDSLLGDDTALVGDVVKWAAGELLAARTVPAAPDNPPTA